MPTIKVFLNKKPYYPPHLLFFRNLNLLSEIIPSIGPRNKIENAYLQLTKSTTSGMSLIEMIEIKNPMASCIVTAVPIYFLSPTSVAIPEY